MLPKTGNVAKPPVIDVGTKVTTKSMTKMTLTGGEKRKEKEKEEAKVAVPGQGKGKVKDQVKVVVGDLENVLGDLKTVVGDLRVLMNQIDIVTTKIDEKYGNDLEIPESQRRRLSTSILETRLTKKNLFRHSTSQSFDCSSDADNAFLSHTDVKRMSPHEDRPKKTERKALIRQMRVNSMDETSSAGTPEPVRRNIRRNDVQNICLYKKPDPILPSQQGISAKHPIREHRSNFELALPRMRNKKDRQPKDRTHRHSASALHDPMHKNCFDCSPSPETESYCGVYEKELDSKLESDESLENYDSFDDGTFGYAYGSYRIYNKSYGKHLNAWTSYASDMISASDDQYSDTASETTSDILNDNFIRTDALDGTMNFPLIQKPDYSSPVEY